MMICNIEKSLKHYTFDKQDIKRYQCCHNPNFPPFKNKNSHQNILHANFDRIFA